MRRSMTILVVLLLALGGCGDDDDDAGDDGATSTTSAEETTTAAPDDTTTSVSPDGTTTIVTTTTSIEPDTTTTVPAGLGQPALWPAADVVFTTPEAAAADFVTQALGVPAELGEFMQGDARSGEIQVFSRGEGDSDVEIERGLLLMRQLGPESGWFVIGAVSGVQEITTPAAGDEVPAAPLTVEGRGRGFEATLVVSAFLAGDATTEFDRQIAMGGSAEATEPFTTELDLSAAQAGDTVVLLVRGGVGLENDPGEFVAIPLVIG